MLVKNPAGYFSRGVFYGPLFFSLLSLSPASQGNPAEPFATRDQNPLVSIYGLPLPVNARLLASGESHWLTSFNLTNTLNVDSTANSELIVDTETSQLNLVYARGLPQDWMLRLQFSISHHEAGFLDSWIYDYHDLLGLKQGDREFVADDQFRIMVSENSNTLIDVQTSQTGMADTQIQLGKQISNHNDRATSLWASIKLPTGDSTKLTGSGHTDIALWLAAQQQHSKAVWLNAQLGGLYMSGTDVLESLHKNMAWFGNFGLNYAYSDALQLKVQFDAHTPLYNSELDFLDTAIQLTFGGSYDFDKNDSIDIAVSEDIKTGSSPDVTFNFSWSREF